MSFKNYQPKKGNSKLYNRSPAGSRDSYLCDTKKHSTEVLGIKHQIVDHSSQLEKLPSRFDYFLCPNGYCFGSTTMGYKTPQVCIVNDIDYNMIPTEFRGLIKN